MPNRPEFSSSRPTTWWPLVVVAALAFAALKATPAGKESPSDAASRASQPAAADPHGRDAQTPSEIPLTGWRDIVMRVYEEISRDRVLAVAAGVTFYGLLALFPAVAALVSLYGLFADASTITTQVGSLSGVLPSGALDIVGEQVKRITTQPHGSLGFAFGFGLLVSLWSANAGMKAMFDALNVVYEETEGRSFVKLNLISLTFTGGAILILIAAMTAVVVVPVALNVVGLGSVGAELIAIARWPLLLLLVVLALSVLYRFGPSRAKAKWRWITWGSALAAVGWLVASLLFSLYVSRFGSYNATYGSLGAVIGFMTWVWISTIVILIGAELSAEIEHQTDVDTTAGPAKPSGARGARMADEVGAAH